MKILADENIPYIEGIVEKYGDVTYLAGSDFTHKNIKNYETLIIRTVCKINKQLLENSKVKLICSATIGFDHIDTDYCKKNNIKWTNAPGCNSGSVMQYIVSALIALSVRKEIDLTKQTIGIVGVGHVGKKVAKACKLLGMTVLLNDPIRENEEGRGEFVSLDDIKKHSDIITFHTPLTKEGEYKTHHLCDVNFFDTLGKTPYIINSARGSIIETNALKYAIEKNKISGAIIDCWENEPNIDLQLLESVFIATPHIAGYSADGKATASKMALEEVAKFWKLPKKPAMSIVPPDIKYNNLDYSKLKSPSANKIFNCLYSTYNIMNDDESLRNNASNFKQLRNNYPLRREYLAYQITNNDDENTKDLLREFGFTVE